MEAYTLTLMQLATKGINSIQRYSLHIRIITRKNIRSTGNSQTRLRHITANKDIKKMLR